MCREKMQALLRDVRACRICAEHLPLGPRPVVQLSTGARLLIVGQAPGTRVHASGLPFDDPSGDRLRAWFGLDRAAFYDPARIGIMPMGFCYPGTGKSGDLPPRPECAPEWHERLLALLPDVKVTLLLGAYALERYLGARRGKTLTETVRRWREFAPEFLPLPHPSPRNNRWLAKNSWFEADVLPEYQRLVAAALDSANGAAEGIRRGLADVEAVRTISLREFETEQRVKHNLKND